MAEMRLDEQAIFEVARKIPSEETRRQYLDQACAEDAQLRERVVALLQAYEEGDNFLESPPTALRSESPNGHVSLALDRPVTESPGDTIGPYKLLEQIGEGGMGVVYMAEQSQPVQRRVALKIIKPGMDTRQVIARFEMERQALAMMDHPNIARVFDVGTTETGRPYFAMELVKGVPITEYCDQQQLTPRERLELFVPVCQAVQHAHQKGVIHRDLKPSNVMVALYDERPAPKIIDFGVAKAISQNLTERTMFTQYGQVVGTVEYMSPEQAQFNQLDVDTRSDVYSLGVLLYELLAGETPFDKERLRSAAFDEMLRIIREEEPPRPSLRLSSSVSLPSIAANRHVEPKKLSTLVHGELDWIVMKALEKDRSRRYESASKFAEDVQHYLHDEAVGACPPSSAYRFRKFARRNKALLSAAAAILLALVTGVIGTTWQAMRATRQRDRAIAAEELASSEATRANEEADRAVEESNRAERQRIVARQEQYYAEIVAGQADLKANNFSSLQRNLLGHLPLGDEPDLRDWEWYYFWSQCRKEERAFYHPYRWPHVAWSPDGKLIGSSGTFWDAQTGKCVQYLYPSQIATLDVAWSPDGQKYAWTAVKNDMSLYIWDRVTDRLHSLPHKSRQPGDPEWTGNLCRVAWSPDGQFVCTGDMVGFLHVWDVANEREVRQMSIEGRVSDILWSPDGQQLIATTGANRREPLRIWDVASGDLLETPVFDGGIVAISWNPKSSIIAISLGDRVEFRSAVDWETDSELELPGGAGGIEWNASGTQLAIDRGTRFEVWDYPSKEIASSFEGCSAIRSLSWSPDERRVVTLAENGDVCIWNLDTPPQPVTIPTESKVSSLAWNPDNKSLVTSDETHGKFSFCNLEDKSCGIVDSEIAERPITFSPDRKLAALRLHSQEEHKIHILEVESGSTQGAIPLAPSKTINTVSFSPDGSRLAVAWRNENLIVVDIWDVARVSRISSWTRRARHAHFRVRRIEWSPDGEKVAVAAPGDFGDDGGVVNNTYLHVIRARDGTRLLKHLPVSGSVTSIAWASDSDKVSIGTSAGIVGVLEVSTNQILVRSETFTDAVTSIAWRSGNRRLACGARDGSVKIYSAVDGSDLLTFSLPKGYTTHLKWSSDAKRLAAASNEGVIYVWDASRGYDVFHGERNDELAINYYEHRWSANDKSAHAGTRKFLQVAPDELGFWLFRGHAFASLGEFDRAEKEYAKAMQGDLSTAFGPAYYRAFALLGSGNVSAFREHCTEMFREFDRNAVPANQINTSWLCCLVPNSSLDTTKLVQMANASHSDPDAEGRDNIVLAIAASLYRDRQFAKAAQILTEHIKLTRDGDSLDKYELACGQYFLAMTLYEMKDRIQARDLLRDANDQAALLEHTELSWRYKVVLKTLRKEAEALIRPDERGQI